MPVVDAAAAVSRLTGRTVTATRRMSGALTEAVLDGGDVVVVKEGHAPGATAAEAAGLRWLAEPAVVPIPVVHGYDEQWLVLDRIDERAAGLGGGRIASGQPGRGARDTAERLGRDLAALHAAGAPAFGSPRPGPGHAERRGGRDVRPGLRSVPGVVSGTPEPPSRLHERTELHQLFPLLVHAVQFGRSYATQALSIAQRLS